MEPNLYVLTGPQTRVQRANVGVNGLGPGPGPRGGEPVLGRGENVKSMENTQQRMFFIHLKGTIS